MSDPSLVRRGQALRTAIANAAILKLRPGDAVPPGDAIARALGISRIAAHKHIRRTLDDHGVITRFDRPRHRLVVVEIRR